MLLLLCNNELNGNFGDEQFGFLLVGFDDFKILMLALLDPGGLSHRSSYRTREVGGAK